MNHVRVAQCLSPDVSGSGSLSSKEFQPLCLTLSPLRSCCSCLHPFVHLFPSSRHVNGVLGLASCVLVWSVLFPGLHGEGKEVVQLTSHLFGCTWKLLDILLNHGLQICWRSIILSLWLSMLYSVHTTSVPCLSILDEGSLLSCSFRGFFHFFSLLEGLTCWQKFVTCKFGPYK